MCLHLRRFEVLLVAPLAASVRTLRDIPVARGVIRSAHAWAKKLRVDGQHAADRVEAQLTWAERDSDRILIHGRKAAKLLAQPRRRRVDGHVGVIHELRAIGF
jgi:hypothetical protein